MMKFLIVMLLLVVVVSAADGGPLAAVGRQPAGNCSGKCGDVEIPYPFGIGDECSLNRYFNITCNKSFTPHQPFLETSTINITKISLNGELHILKLIGKECYDNSGIKVEPNMTLPKFSINDTLNKFVVVGCDSYGYLLGEGFTTGCISICNDMSTFDNGICDGVGCCKTSIRKQMLSADLTVASFRNHSRVLSFNPCTYAFVVEDKSFKFSRDGLKNLQHVEKLPMVLAWTIGIESCEEAKNNRASYACVAEHSTCNNASTGYSGYRCSCLEGYEGNPYLLGGCKDIDECAVGSLNDCKFKEKYCKNTEGNYTCSCPEGYSGHGRGNDGCTKNRKLVNTATGTALGVIVLLLAACLLYLELKRRKSNRMKQQFFLQNGGMLLHEKLTRSRGETSTDHMVRIFNSSELQKATNGFHNSMIIGQGGFGTVYKGILHDNTIVAIKKSKRVDPNEIEQFINEVFVLSQINHRNVVRLLGCCLDTEVPLLVYEFINNGTLSAHLHNQAKARLLNWETRLRIAAETAGVLSYLHSAASTPIVHRDVKSDNILLDHIFTAKVADFGASRLVPIDHTQLSTMVQGTFGYLDPEYLQTNQLTEKSDVYSFGVVLLELLTGRKAISFDKPEEEKNLAHRFLFLLKQQRLPEILDDNVMRDGNREQIMEVAMLAKGCLNVKGEDRPSMKEVAMELDGLRLGGKHSWARKENDAEEMESLIGEQLLNGFDNGDGNITSIVSSVGYGSIRDHVVLPMNGGR